jgi:hypothetical protein
MKKIYYLKWIGDDDPDFTEYYRVTVDDDKTYQLIFIDVHDSPNEEEPYMSFNPNETTEDIEDLLKDKDILPSTREEFMLVLREHFHLTQSEMEKLLNENTETN